MKTLLQWLRLHPIKAVLFTMIFTAIATSAAFREDLIPELSISYALMIALWIYVFERDRRQRKVQIGIGVTLTSLMLCFSLLPPHLGILNAQQAPIPNPKQQENAAAVGVGVVVICVAGFCLYKIVKICQKKFPPKNTNAPPEESFSAEVSSDEYGGACEYSSIGSCYVMPPPPDAFPYEDLTMDATTFTMNVKVAGGMASSSINASRALPAQTWDEYTAEMATHGLFLTGGFAWEPQYEVGGVPCDPSAVPLSFDTLTGKVTHNTGGERRLVTVERSPNMENWFPLLVTEVSDGTKFQVVDTTREGQMFYRTTVQ